MTRWEFLFLWPWWTQVMHIGNVLFPLHFFPRCWVETHNFVVSQAIRHDCFWANRKKKMLSCSTRVSIPLDWVCTTKRKSRTNSWDAAQRLGFHSVFTFSPLRLQKCQGGLWNPPSKIEFSRVKKKHAAVGVGRRLMKERLLSSLLLLGLLWKGFEITVFYLRWSWHP